MTVYVFVVDNSASMAQTTASGATLLDLARMFIEYFMKQRTKEKDRFMVVTCDEFPQCVKAAWREPVPVLTEQCKRLRPTGTTALKTAVGRALWILNLNRFSYGAKPVQDVSVAVIVLTDGFLLDSAHQFVPDKIPMASSPFLTEEFRPDHKVFAIMLKDPANRSSSWMSAVETQTNGTLAQYCASTGGKCYTSTNTRHLMNVADLISFQMKATPGTNEDKKALPYPHNILKEIDACKMKVRKEIDEYCRIIAETIEASNVELYMIKWRDTKTEKAIERIQNAGKYNPKDFTEEPCLNISYESRRRPKHLPSAIFTDPSLMTRDELIEAMVKMRVNFHLYGRDSDLHVLQGGMPGHKIKLHEAEDLHSRPVKDMGEYDSYVRRLKEIGLGPLRELEPPEIRSQAFGNPYKLDRKVVDVDEVGESQDESENGSRSPSSNSSRSPIQKRKVKLVDLSAFTRLRNRNMEISSVASSRASSPDTDFDMMLVDTDDVKPDKNGIDSVGVECNGNNGNAAEDRAVSPSPSIVNGFSNLSLKRTVSFSEEEASGSECSSPPPMKKRRESVGAAGGLNYMELKEKKRKAVFIVKAFRLPMNPSQTVSKVMTVTEGLRSQDRLAILGAAVQAARTVHRPALVKALEDTLRSQSRRIS